MSSNRVLSCSRIYHDDLSAQGRQPTPAPPAGTTPPLDALGFRHYSRRFARSARVLDALAVALSPTAVRARLTPAKRREVCDDLAAIGEICEVLRVAVGGNALAPPAGTRGSGRPSPPPWCPTPFELDRDVAYVAGMRGLLHYSVRHLTPMLAGSAATSGDLEALRAGLAALGPPARRLGSILRMRGRARTPRTHPGRRSGSDGPDTGGVASGVDVEDVEVATEGLHGTYAIHYILGVPATVTVKSGLTYELPAGRYAYIGSAFSSGGVATRVAWHLDRTKPPQKNVDFLKPVALPVEVWWTHDEDRRECRWSAAMASSAEYHCPAPKFGATDCLVCPAHLYHSLGPPDVHDFARRLAGLVPGHAPVYRLRLDLGE